MEPPASPRLERRDYLICLALLAAVFVVHAASPNATPFDSRWTVHTAMSILREGNTDLDEYLDIIEADDFYGVECVNPDGTHKFPMTSSYDCPTGHVYNWYPIAVPAMVTPLVAALDIALRAGQPLLRPLAGAVPSPALAGLLRGDLLGSSAAVQVLLASLIIAVAAALCFLLGREFLGRMGAAGLALIFAFCTPAWSIASRALWQHGPSMLLLTAMLLIAARAERKPELIRWLGALVVFAFFLRPTHAVSALVLTIFVWVHYRRQFTGFLLSALPMGLLFDIYHQSVYFSSLAPYSFVTRKNAASLSLHSRLFEALTGNLISPSRGLIIFVPLVLLAVYGMFLRPRHRAAQRLRPYLIAIVCLHWLLISTYEDWWAGHSFGPRYFSDITPVLLFFLIPVLERLETDGIRRRLALASVLAVLTLAGFFVHFQGATNWACYEWNATPVDVHEDEARIWDWSDPQFLRGVRR